MALPNFRQAAISNAAPPPIPGAQTMMAGSPVSFNILKERLRSTPGSPGGGFFFQGNKPEELKANPFVQNQYGNSAFNPQRLGIRPLGGTGVPKPPRAPEKPLVPYMRYSRKVWDSVRNQNPDMKLWEIGKMIGQMWRDLPDVDKQEFQDEYDLEKQQYEKDLNVYKQSPGYLAYVQAKCRGNPVIEDPEPKGIKTAERRIDIQPAEDEEDPDDGLSVKHISHARFTRNHRLINEVFSETMVPDVRSVVTTARMQVLKRQVQSLTMHQKKLEAELTQIEEKYNQKKRKFLDSSEDFSKELKKHCSKVVDESKYNEMVNEQLEKLRMEREERARAGAPTPPSPTPPTDPADTRHVLQPVERGADNPDSPQDEEGKTGKTKEKEDNSEKMSETTAEKETTGNGGLDAAKTSEAENKSSETNLLSNSTTNNRPEDPPLQYADMANQKSLPTQSQMQEIPTQGQNLPHGGNIQSQVTPPLGQPSTNIVTGPTVHHGDATSGVPSNVDISSHQSASNISVSSQLISTPMDHGNINTPTTAAAAIPKNEYATQPSAATAAVDPATAPTTDITPPSHGQFNTQTNIAPITNTPTAASTESCPQNQGTTPQNTTESTPSQNVAPETHQSQPVAPNYPLTSEPSSGQPLPPSVQEVPPSYPPQQGTVPYGHPTTGYATDPNTPFASAPPPPGPGYPDTGYGAGYHSYAPQPQTGTYPPPPPSESYNMQAPSQRSEPIVSTQTAAVAPDNLSNINNTPPSVQMEPTETASKVAADGSGESSASIGETSSNIAATAASTAALLEQAPIPNESVVTTITENKPNDSVDQKDAALSSNEKKPSESS